MSTASTPAISERRVALPGVEIHLREAGEGPPLVLLHGWPQHGAMWEPLIGELARDHRVLVPDMRGAGLSEAPEGAYDKHTLAGDVLALLDAEGIEQAAIVGHDWGGWVAWLLALEHPDRVERFADLDVPAPWSRDNRVSPRKIPKQLLFSSYQWLIASPRLGRHLVSSPQWVERFIRGGSTRREVWTEARLRVFSEPLRAPGHSQASVMMYRTFLLHELPQVARGTYTRDELEVPGLVVMGAESRITTLIGPPAPRPGLEVELLPGVGHYVVDEAPEEVLELLQPFLAAGR